MKDANVKDRNVELIQKELIKRGYGVGLYGADGYFRENTFNAVIRFQEDYGLKVDDIVGKIKFRCQLLEVDDGIFCFKNKHMFAYNKK